VGLVGLVGRKMAPLKDKVRTMMGRCQGNITADEATAAEQGDVVDIAVSVAGMSFVRIDSTGQEQQVNTAAICTVGALACWCLGARTCMEFNPVHFRQLRPQSL
jgi:hypothetical protein